MRRKTRLAMFLPAALALAAVFALAFAGLPAVGNYRGPYGDVVNAIVVPERHVTDAVTAVNFDIRGFDTLGEEFILFISVMGAALLLRIQRFEQRREHEDFAMGRRITPSSDALRVVAMLLTAPTLLFGIYIVVHGQLTPGGGFQGGVILASAVLLLYLLGEFETYRTAVPREFVHLVEAFGAFVYPAVGVLTLAGGGAFLQNIVPLGSKGSILSGGTIPIINAGVALEVFGGVALVLTVYLEEMLEHKQQ